MAGRVPRCVHPRPVRKRLHAPGAAVGRRGRMILSDMVSSLPTTLGALRREVDAGRIRHRSVRTEIRENLMARLKAGGPIFPGIVGYDDTVIPQLLNATGFPACTIPAGESP